MLGWVYLTQNVEFIDEERVILPNENKGPLARIMEMDAGQENIFHQPSWAFNRHSRNDLLKGNEHVIDII